MISTKGRDIINTVAKGVGEPTTIEEQTIITNFGHMELLELHSRALACHCECLGMNAENSSAVCKDIRSPYAEDAYYTVMEKWGLVDKDGKPII